MPRELGGKSWRLLVESALLIVDWMVTRETVGDEWPNRVPVIRVVVDGHVDVGEMVHTAWSDDVLNGGPPARWAFGSVAGADTALLEMPFDQPVDCTVRLALTLPRHREVLEAAAACGHLALTTQSLSRMPGREPWVRSICREVDVDPLRSWLVDR
jgi:hypothetical protein